MKNHFKEIFMISVCILLYYLLFANRGIVLNDEGYYAHYAERILRGDSPYKDFFIQFPPGYFYIIALVYKLFGMTIMAGRYFTVAICIAIALVTLAILRLLKVQSIKVRLLSILSLTAFGYPLINHMAMLAWISVLTSLFIIYFYISWYKNQKSIRYLFLLGLALSFQLFFKQNLGLYFIVTANILLLISQRSTLKNKIKTIVITDAVVAIFTSLWVYYFFIRTNGIEYFNELVTFNKRYLDIYPFSYPPFTYLFQPLGIFKLLPYYLPIIFLFVIFIRIIKRQARWDLTSFALFPLVGFAGTVYPTSDLLHVYPFFGPLLAAILVFFYKTKQFVRWAIVVTVLITSGFYLTWFREYNRYQAPYQLQNSPLNLPRTRGILVTKPLAESAETVYAFLQKNTTKSDTVLMYPFAEMLYFIFEKRNPSRYSIYYPGYLSFAQEQSVIEEMKNHETKYVVTSGGYQFKTPLSEFIQDQKLVLSVERFKVFEIHAVRQAPLRDL